MAEFKLTKEQQAVVDNSGGTLLVSAAAGSGKTMVLIERVLKTVQERECDLDRFLMITYTQAAAAELRGKLVARLSEALALCPEDRHLQRQMSRVYLTQISTVHSFCAAVLREYAHVIDLPADFSVCDEQEAEKLRERALKTVLDAAYEKRDDTGDVAAALDMLGAGKDDANLPQLIVTLHNSLQSYCDPAKRLQTLRAELDCASCTDVGETVWGQYLIAQLHTYLDRSLERLQKLFALAQGELGKYLPAIQNSMDVIIALRQKETWEEIRAFSCRFEKFASIRNCEDPELKEYVKNARNGVNKGVEAWKARFSLPSEEAMKDLAVSAKALRGLTDLTERFSKAYAEQKRRAHMLDYDDLEHEMLRLVRIRFAAKELSERYEQIMVDEYQDTNEVQDTIFRLISREEENLFFVGDVKQSIYGFRRADPTIFLEKYKTFADYKAAKPGEPRKILLSDNFRSHPAILEAANDVFRLTMSENVGGLRYGDAEALRPNRPAADMGSAPVELHCIEKDSVRQTKPRSAAEIEADFVASRIRKMLDGGERIPDGEDLRQIRAEDVVILLRSMKNRAEVYESALAKQGIKYVSDNDNIFETEEITVLTALLQVIDNPHQDIPLLTVLMSPLFGCTANELALARAKRGGDIWEIMQGSEACSVLNELRTAAQTSSLRRLLDIADERLFLRTIYGAMENGRLRLQNINRFFALADSYETGDRFGLSGFVRYLALLRDKGVGANGQPGGDAVRLTTVHKSKGLEYPVVFLCGLGSEFRFSEKDATVLINSALGLASDVYDPEQVIKYPTIAKNAVRDRIRRENLSEEMRILYVGMTRAKYRLVMTCCKNNLTKKLNDLAHELTVPAQDALIEAAASLGDWVLMTALTHTEAGELFAAGGNPEDSRTPEYPWAIRFYRSSMLEEQSVQPVPAEEEKDAVEYVPLHYAHEKAVSAPSKVTATQLKGRALDSEVYEETAPLKLTIRKPHFTYGKRRLTPAERGTAIHLAMQYIRYESCTDLQSVKRELDRLVDLRFLTEQQREAVPEEKIRNFFRSALGRRVLSAERVIREYKFSVLEDGSLLDPALAGEKLLLQGVTDCCLIENGELTILDFKSDHVLPGREEERAAYYRGQLDAYSKALSRIFDLPVKERILYFFSTDTAINA
ncbi:MAG: helicase-exonuclease AddAB subunit AddA [Oscillospiraceae bacterium]|nr:helicase-exonuclease AddAB subunit AddA [Oscillospiraceae bacterium]